ncbi:MAG: response regulator [Desulfovibrio sp.]|jgi:signal transduction histidine kinase/DNA-binding NarL/FixJ family response regulator/HPt (histidine-containing phosphotransfer) domain-containing protein|nr:response regulator [Desulfovibrio sp.]
MKIPQMRFYLFITGLGFFVAFGVGLVLHEQYQNYITKSYTETLENVTTLIEKLYPEMHDVAALKREAGTDAFWEKSRKLVYIRNSFSLAYIYYVEKTESGYVFLMSSGIQKGEHEEWLGQPVWKDYRSIPSCVDEAYKTKKIAFTSEPTINEWGEHHSVSLPIITNDQVVGVLGVDYNMTYINTLRRTAHISLGLAFALAAATITLQSVIGSRFVITPMQEKQADERTRLMIDATPMICSLWDKNGKILDCNKTALAFFGLRDKKTFIEHFHRLSPEIQPDGQISAEKMALLLKAALDEGHQRFDWMFRTSRGEPLPTETIMVRVPWRGTDRIAAYSRDLREAKANEQKIRQADERSRAMEVQAMAAKAASEAKGNFLASMSHEIRTPMNVIIGLGEMMRTDNMDREQREFFSDIRKMAKTLLQIINDILDFSKIEAGKMSLVPINFDLEELYADITSLHRFMAENKGLEFRSSFGADVPRIVYGDDTRIRQIITNTISNAIKYTRAGYVDFRVGRVSVDGREYTAFVVEDTGIGIKRENFSKLFDMFEQLDRQQNRDISGTGLGLSITQRLVRMMDGKIEIESEYGKGSCFTVLLPLPEGDESKIRREEAKEQIMADNTTKVLVVDDNPLNLKVALAHLARHNIRADSVESGEEAIQKAKEKQYDLLLMDHMMPEMDGLRTTAQIRALDDWYRSVPIIALTANVVAGTRGLFQENGLNDYLSKPIMAAELNRVLAEWLPAEKKIAPENEGLRQPGPAPDYPVAASDSRLDKNAGIRNAAGDEILYQRLLEDFVARHAEDAEKIREAVETGDKTTAHRIAHTLKSTAAIIGAADLSIAAEAVEKSLSGQPFALIPEDLDMLAAECHAVQNAIGQDMIRLDAQTGRQTAAAFEDATVPDRERALELLDKLEPLLKSGNASCLELIGAIQEILGPFESECQELAKLMDDFDFSEAAERLAAIRKKIEPGRSPETPAPQA